jgi:hypothetical protein
MFARQKLESAIDEWCRENKATHRLARTPGGDRYEVQWVKPEDPSILRIINIYPGDRDQVIVQKGVADPNKPSRLCSTGPIYNRTVDQVYPTLTELKPFADQLSREYLVDDAPVIQTAPSVPASRVARFLHRHA